jgi:catechol 2,3-dioxygenase-like lactoylglutathione lyase family enzyme
MAHRYHHAHIKSKDPRSTAVWWAEMFGAEPLPEFEFGSMLFTPVRLGDVTITITRPDPAEGTARSPAVPHYGLEHIGIQTDDLSADLERFAEQGLRIYEHRMGPAFEVAFVEAPDGVLIELLQPLEERTGD